MEIKETIPSPMLGLRNVVVKQPVGELHPHVSSGVDSDQVQ